MRARAFVPMFLFAISLPALAGEEKKENAIEVDLSYLEKTWSIKCKSQKVAAEPFVLPQDRTTGPRVKIIFLLEFTQDVVNLKELRTAFALPTNPNNPNSSLPTAPLLFYFFDEENVCVYKSPPNAIEGEVTGKKGDAIRVSLIITNNHLKKTHKIEARPRETEKDKDKGKK